MVAPKNTPQPDHDFLWLRSTDPLFAKTGCSASESRRTDVQSHDPAASGCGQVGLGASHVQQGECTRPGRSAASDSSGVGFGTRLSGHTSMARLDPSESDLKLPR